MKTLLIHPPAEEDLLFKEIIGLTPQPIGLAYVAAAAEENGHKVEIMDIPAESITKKQFIKKLKNYDPDVVGVYLATYRHTKGLEALELAKKHTNETKTICGGPHSSVMAEELAKNNQVDYVISGEAEKTFPSLLEALDGEKSEYDVKGITFSESGDVITTPPPKKNRGSRYFTETSKTPTQYEQIQNNESLNNRKRSFK